VSLILYHSPFSTCSQKVRLALAEKGLDYDSRIIELSRQEHLEDWYLAINPNGVVPSLVHNGRPVVDSSVICEYLDDVFPEPALGPRDPLGRAAMRTWMRYFEEVPTTAIRVPSFNKLFAAEIAGMDAAKFDAMTSKMPLRKQFYRQMFSEGCPEQQYRDSLEKLRQCLVRVERQLADGRAYLLGGDFSIADIALVPSAIRMLDLELHELWCDLPRFRAWLDTVQARPSFAVAYSPGSRVRPQPR